MISLSVNILPHLASITVSSIQNTSDQLTAGMAGRTIPIKKINSFHKVRLNHQTPMTMTPGNANTMVDSQ